MVTFEHSGSFKNLERLLEKTKNKNVADVLIRYAEQGVAALAAATPVDSGITAGSWSYNVSGTKTGFQITFTNSVRAGTAPLAILLQYGHGTGTGGYVRGRDFINPAIQPVFDLMAEAAWKEVGEL